MEKLEAEPEAKRKLRLASDTMESHIHRSLSGTGDTTMHSCRK